MNKICTKCGGKEIDGYFFYKKHSECKWCNSLRVKSYLKRDKEKTNIRNKKYRDTNKEKVTATRRKHSAKNVEYIRKRSSDYYLNNRQHILNKSISYRKNKLKTDPLYKLRESISSAIRSSLQLRGGSKAGFSCYKYLDYSNNELKKHLEILFEPWMNWNNWGVYNKKTWNDNDPSTWTWQIDHIIPHSTFKYTSMEDIEFQKCWALTNLRPLSSKDNLIKSNRFNLNDEYNTK